MQGSDRGRPRETAATAPTVGASVASVAGPTVAAPGTGDGHIDLLGHLTPGPALVTKLQDLLCRCGMSGRAAAAYGDAAVAELLTDGGPMNA